MIQISPVQEEQLKSKGISVETLQSQVERFKTGMIYADLDRPATVNDGIQVFNPKEVARYIRLFDEKAPGLDLQKFIPASGAATRMFKDLYEFIHHQQEDQSSDWNSLPERVRKFGLYLPELPFWKPLKEYVEKHNPALVYKTEPRILQQYVSFLLNSEGLQYGFLPKALLLFHCYDDGCRMPFEEHLVEWALINSSGTGDLKMHFTLSPQHVDPFQHALMGRLPGYELRFDRHFSVDHSLQHPSTDTVATDEKNNPMVDEEGKFLFRPGGHGALLYNLNHLDADLVFLKNIDNVALEPIEAENVSWKKLLGGLLIEVMHEIHQWLYALEQADNPPALLQQAASFIEKRFGTPMPYQDEELNEKVWSYLNRPIRVCGMVRNTGEPGGGPFWVRNGDGSSSLQIVESAQINMGDSLQKSIAGKATHFNPVDLVCCLRNYRKEKFNLHHFTDPDTSFISLKSHQGEVLKALEHPGLWNGAMSNWITMFVEVPLQTFNPVKTVHDLFRPEHFSVK